MAQIHPTSIQWKHSDAIILITFGLESIWMNAERVYCTLLLIENAVFIHGDASNWIAALSAFVISRRTYLRFYGFCLLFIENFIRETFSFFAHSVIRYVIVMLQLFPIQRQKWLRSHFVTLLSLQQHQHSFHLEILFQFVVILFHKFDSISLIHGYSLYFNHWILNTFTELKLFCFYVSVRGNENKLTLVTFWFVSEEEHWAKWECM